MPEPFDPSHIRAAFAVARRASQARQRDIAQALLISEGELVAAHAGPREDDRALHATRLSDAWPALIEALEPLGEVMALTRNASCVHEKTGVYREASHSGQTGMVVGGAIDLRVFYSRWAHGFAVEEATPRGLQRSLQFFDPAGSAVHKVFERAASNAPAWDALVARFTAAAQPVGMVTLARPPSAPERPDPSIDVDALRIAWAAMTDTHQFHGLLYHHGVRRTQALRLADPRFAQAVPPTLAERVLNDVARDGVPIMVFVGNPGMLQIHSGPVRRVTRLGPWLNVLDPGFSMHLRADHIAQAWIVKKPTRDGIVTSLELFDIEGETIAMFFGAREPRREELPAWRHLVAAAATALASERKSCAA